MSDSTSTPRKNPTRDRMRKLQDVGSQLTNVVRSMVTEMANNPAAPLTEPFSRFSSQIADLSTMWVNPLQALLKQQQEFFEVMAQWGVQQRALADRLEELAAANQRLTDQLSSKLQPFVEQSETTVERVRPPSSARRSR
jgi:hypothetical protein